MIDKSSEAINSFYSYLRSVLDNPDRINNDKLEQEATNYLDRNPHVKDSIDFFSLVGGIKERIEVVETLDFGITQMLDDQSVDHIEWYDEYLKNNRSKRPYWQRYFNYFLSTGISSVVLKGIDTTTDRILAKCENPLRPGPWSNKGLVVGVVQGGKTTHMIGLCNKAIDAQYKLIIVFPGLLEDLRLQTHERFDAGLIGVDTQTRLDENIRTFTHGVSKYNKKLNVYNYTTANKKGDSVNNLKNIRINTNGDPSIVIVKKNTTILQHLVATIARSEKAFKDVPTLIIDDESDLASINIKNPGDIEKITQDEITKTPLYIRALISLFDKNAYIGYTATPYANIFQHHKEKAVVDSRLDIKWKDRYGDKKIETKSFDLGEGLFPKNFICSLPVYSNYIGFEKIFGDRYYDDGEFIGNSVIKTVTDYVDADSYKRLNEFYSNIDTLGVSRRNPKPDSSEINGWMPPFHESDWLPNKHFDLPESLKEAICYFVISNIIKNIRKITPMHNSMLINVSRFKNTNGSIRDQVQEYLFEISAEFGLKNKKSEIYKKFFSLWKSEFENKLNDQYIYPSRKIIWDEIESSIPNELEKIRTLLITGDNDYLEYTNNKSVSVIAVGGVKLSRGITLEGLSVSYFLRKSIYSAADSVTQMGRWFGYRPRYDDICKLYLTPFVLDDFRQYYEDEEDLRTQLFSMERKGLDPTQFGLMVKQKQPTARNRMRFAKRRGIERNFSAKFKQQIFVNIEENSNNIEIVDNLFNKINKKPELSKDGFSKVWKNVNSEFITDFLTDFKSPSDYSRFTEEAYIDYIYNCNLLGDELKQWNVALVSNKTGEKIFNFLGYDLYLKKREYDAFKQANKEDILKWDGDPKNLEKFKGEDQEIFRLSALTEKEHEYIDMNISKKEADELLENAKKEYENEGKRFKPSMFWRKKREKPILILYPFTSKGDKSQKFIYLSYAIIFPKSLIVSQNASCFKPKWETLNSVLVEQLDKYKKVENRI